MAPNIQTSFLGTLGCNTSHVGIVLIQTCQRVFVAVVVYLLPYDLCQPFHGQMELNVLKAQKAKGVLTQHHSTRLLSSTQVVVLIFMNERACPQQLGRHSCAGGDRSMVVAAQWQ